MLLGEHLGSYPEDLKRTVMAISSISKTISKGFNKLRERWLQVEIQWIFSCRGTSDIA
jgi:hypothetical protein